MTQSQSVLACPSAFADLSPIIVSVFLGFVAMSLPLAALAVEMSDHLGYSPLVIGCVIGLESIVTLMTRDYAGALSDRRGSRFVVILGLPLTAVAGLIVATAALLPIGAAGKLAFLILSRVIMGLGESLFLTGLMSWGIARMGAARTGQVMSWTGIAIYAALGLGATLGLAIQASLGFAAVGAVMTITPIAALLIVLGLAETPVTSTETAPSRSVFAIIWRPGLVLALATMPFAVIEAFLALDFVAHGWAQAGLALTAFATAYILVRLLGGSLPDRIGAVPVAMGSLILEALGQLLLWLAPSPMVAVLGAALTGLGFSLVFPAMGVLATRSVPREQRGRAVGNFVAFADVAMGATGPTLGIAVQWFGVTSAFLAGTVAACTALCVLPSIRRRQITA